MKKEHFNKSLKSMVNSFLIKYKKKIRFGLHILNIVGILGTIYGFYWSYQQQIFTSEIALRNLLNSMGALAPYGFMGIQIVQTVIPIIPGALTIPMGTMIFGAGYGFFLNFVSIMIGSVLNFAIARKLGRPFMELLAGDKKINKYIRWLDDPHRFDRLFTFGMFFPLSPADFLCYLAGLSSISFRKYFVILALGKPITLLIYSYGMTKVLNVIFQVLG